MSNTRKLGQEAQILTVDFAQSLTEMIAAGRYDWTNSDITAERFPLVGKGVMEFEPELVHPDCSLSSEAAVKRIEKRGLVPATMAELLAYGAANPEQQREFPIVGLGSVAEVRGRRRVPYLGRHGAERDLYLDWWDDGWYPVYRFLGVRRKSSGS